MSGHAVPGGATTEHPAPARVARCVLRRATHPGQFLIDKDDVAVTLESLLPQLTMPAESHVLILDNVGHVGFFEQPDVIRRAVLDFAGRVFRREE